MNDLYIRPAAMHEIVQIIFLAIISYNSKQWRFITIFYNYEGPNPYDETIVCIHTKELVSLMPKQSIFYPQDILKTFTFNWINSVTCTTYRLQDEETRPLIETPFSV